jgi:D-alanyl-D-alanine carboxypeptidase/D-alanyl-D-alanine-endopeptidase (penicillin-binding protein 4)
MPRDNKTQGSKYPHFSLASLFTGYLLLVFASCTTQKKIAQPAPAGLPEDPAMASAHIGICVYDPGENKFLYKYQSDKYFTPASNTKLFSLYAGLRYLGDSLTGVRYFERDTELVILPTGDPTLLHPDYHWQPVIDFLKKSGKSISVANPDWKEEAWGAGWSWDDYNGDYAAERSPMPVYGNVIRWVQQSQKQGNQQAGFGASPSVYSLPEVNWKVKFSPDTGARNFYVKRALDENIFEITEGTDSFKTQDVPFVTHGLLSAVELLRDTVGKNISIIQGIPLHHPALKVIHTQPIDSMYSPMMHRSDNFFAEQTLLMASNERLGLMNDEKMVDTLLGTDLKGLPQRPHWADGSGLSRFNLFTPEDFVWLLNKLKDDFGLERMKRILPTGGTGTLRSYYRQDAGHIFAKTGSLSGVVALSGYLITDKNRLLIFSVLVNNSTASGVDVRRAIERFITGYLRQY